MVIIGAGLGGLSAAIHARLRGWDVLLLEQHEQVGGKAAGLAISGYELDPGPSIVILPQIYASVFAAAGRRMDDYLQFDRLPIISRVFFEGEPALDLPADEEACLALLKDMSPSDAESLRMVMEKLTKVEPLLHGSVYRAPIDSWKDFFTPALLRFGMGLPPLTSYKALVDKWFRLPLLRAFFYGFPSYGGQGYEARSPGSFLIPYYMLRDGVYFPRGGVRAIPEAFRKLAVELGVEIKTGSRVTAVAGGDGRMTSVVMASGEVIEADAFISNLDRFQFDAMRGQTHQEDPSYSYFTVHWGLRKAMPELEHHNLFVPREFEAGFDELYAKQSFPARPIVYVNATAGHDPKAAPAGCSNVFSVVTAPAVRPGLDWEASREEFVTQVRREMAGAGIEFDDAEVDFQRVQDPPYFAARHGNYRGSLYGLSEEHRFLGMFPAPVRDREWKNLAFCGGSVQPGAGMPMVVLSGRFAAETLS